MPPKRDPGRDPEMAKRTEALNVVFAVSSLALLVAMSWMIWADYDREWKRYQIDFNRLEIAQTEACYGTRLANFWMHGYFLQMDESTRMSKSGGGFLQILHSWKATLAASRFLNRTQKTYWRCRSMTPASTRITTSSVRLINGIKLAFNTQITVPGKPVTDMSGHAGLLLSLGSDQRRFGYFPVSAAVR